MSTRPGKVHCPNATRGCNFAVSTEALREHENRCQMKHKMGIFREPRDFECKYEGCGFRISNQELEDHLQVCPQRRVVCPDGLCGDLVKFCDLEQHILGVHQDAVWEAAPTNALGRMWFINSDDHFANAENNWVLNLWKYNGYTFIARFRKYNGIWYSWVYIIGGVRDANKYCCQICTENPDGVADSALMYMGRVHPVDETETEIMRNSDCLTLTNEVVQNHVTTVQRIGMYVSGYDYRIGMDYILLGAENVPMQQDVVVYY